MKFDMTRASAHHTQSEDLYLQLDVDQSQGLTEAEAQRRLAEYGLNRLEVKQGEGPLLRFLLQMHQPLVYILNVSALVSAFLGEWVDAGVIFAVVIVNAVVGFLQESRALAAIEALSRALVSEATVLRDGEKRRISSEQLAPGDVVLLASGDRVGADMRLVSCRGLAVEEAALTGEAVPANKQPQALAENTLLADRTNMAYGSTFVVSGTGVGVVVATGEHSEIGRISEMIASQEILDTPLTRKMAHFSMVLLYAIMSLALVTFVVGVVRGETWFDMLMAAVALAVGAIPEGLPAAMTITLAIGVARMAKRQAIIRKLPAVETLGGTTVICSDKTGTLTLNQMTVRRLISGSMEVGVTQSGYTPQGQFEHDDQPVDIGDYPGLVENLRAGLLCNDAVLLEDAEQWEIEGDPTEGALLTSAGKAGLRRETVEQEWPRLDAIPFESEYQYMATLHGGNGHHTIFIKGSSEKVLPRCAEAQLPDGTLSSFDPDLCKKQIAQLSSQGLRVLTLARKFVETDQTTLGHEDLENLTFLGFQAMSDPPRPEAMEAVAACRKAGIAVKMITGDHAGTAAAIAREIGLGDNGILREDQVISGADLEAMEEETLAQRVSDLRVFARVAPEQKLRLVKALQAQGHVVAMTGDGTNDAPALRRGDIGVAMGLGGTEVSREAADMVLTDDNFASIEAAVEEGRGVFDNLIKFITWTLPTNIGMGLVILAAVFSGAVLPILPVQILWINMTTVVLLGLTLAFEPMEPGIMDRPPRNPEQAILDRPLIMRILLVGVLLLAGSFGLFQYELMRGQDAAVARTTAANVFVIVELFYLFNCRSLTKSMFSIGVWTNPLLIWGCLLMLLLQLAYTYVPFMNSWFSTAPVDLTSWMLTFGCGLVVYIIIGIEKKLQLWTPH